MDGTVRFPLASWYTSQQGTAIEQMINKWLSYLGHRDLETFFSHPLKGMPDPFGLLNMADAARALLNVLQAGPGVLIVGDYDVDGVTSTALLVRFFRQCGFEVDWLIPNRFNEGYGLTEAVVRRIVQRQPQLVVTVDNGITAKAEVSLLKAEGIEVIITDHHLPIPGKTPETLVVNPKQAECDFVEPDLSGVGVAFLLLVSIRKILREEGYWQGRAEPNLLEALDLVAIGSVADQVPLVGLNRLLTYHGLEQMKRRLVEPSSEGGAYTYLKVFQADQRFSYIDSETLGFRLGPLLNAAGRMDDASLAVHFLLETEPAKSKELLALLQRCNQQRKKKQATMYTRALAQVEESDPSGLVLVDDSFHEGLVGIIASKISEKFQCPTLIGAKSADGVIKCSGRTQTGDLTELLATCKESLLGYGGHAKAAGCQFQASQLEVVRQTFRSAAQQQSKVLEPSLSADFEITTEMLTGEWSFQLKRLEPFGLGNQKPIFWISQLYLGEPRPIGEHHLKWAVAPGLDFIRWDGASEQLSPGWYGVAFSLGENHFRGKVSLQAIIQNYQPASAPEGL